MKLWQYTNGIGHLVMSLVATIAGLILVLGTADPNMHGAGISIILGVQAYWFVSSSAKQVASEVVKQVAANQSLPSSTSSSTSTTTTTTN